MKKIILALIILLSLTSCSTSNKEIDKKVEIIEKANAETSPELKKKIENINANKNSLTKEKVVIKTGKYCLMDMCIPESSKAKKEWNYYIAIKKEWTEKDDNLKTYTYKYKTDWTFFEEKMEEMMHTKTITINKLKTDYIKSEYDLWCGLNEFSQNIYNKDWFKYKQFSSTSFTNVVKVWNYYYDLNLSWTWMTQPNFYMEQNNFYEFNIEKNDDIWKFLEKEITKTSKKIISNYLINIKEFPWILFQYKIRNSIWTPLRVVYLWTDKTYLSKNISNNWDFKDLKITNKILWYYSDEWNESFRIAKKSNWDKVFSATSKQIPVFSLKKFNESWYYIVYLKSDYEAQLFAEMCKPVVYYYSKNEIKNSLTINPKKDDYFTKIIPDFNSENKWFFSANNWEINVNWKNYDYLYYSLTAKNYKSNENWWIVKWIDINDFFTDKLSKIWFNDKEKKDFIEYWLNEYEKEKYYFVSFKYKDELDQIIKLDFEKKPWIIFRVLLDSYEINPSKKVLEKFSYSTEDKTKFDKELIQKFERNKFDEEVFEWWGVLIKKDETVVY